MSLFTGQGVTLTRYPCYIKEEKIWRVPDVPEESYNLLDYDGRLGQPPLYAIFASIDENNPEKIKEFCNRFGFLGVRCSSIVMGNKEERDLVNAPPEVTESLDYIIGRAREINQPCESLTDIKREILMMRAIMGAVSAIGLHNEELLIKNVQKTEMLQSHDNITDIEAVNEDVSYIGNFSEAQSMLFYTINQYLSDITPTLSYNPYTNKITGGWEFNNLLSGMYVLLFNELSKGLYVKHCQNETCRNYFPTSAAKMDAKYCSPECARAQASREYRRRKKKKQADKVSDQH